MPTSRYDPSQGGTLEHDTPRVGRVGGLDTPRVRNGDGNILDPFDPGTGHPWYPAED